MVVDQLRDYLEHGNLQNAVNFPDAAMPREAPYRLAIANANVPDMLGQHLARARQAQDQHPQHAEQVQGRDGVHHRRCRQPRCRPRC